MTDRPRVVVTGARGFIGSHLLAALERRGAETVAFEGDYHDAERAEKTIRSTSPATLVHSAWRIAGGSSYLHDSAHLEELRASLRLFTSAQHAGCERIVGIGTCLEYDQTSAPTPEVTPLVPRTLYGAAKAALFMTTQAWAQDASVAFAWARLYHPYGPREAPQRLIPSVVNALLRGERVATTAGLQRRSFLHVEDVADAVAAIALSDATGPLNVGSADATSVREVVERLAQIVGRLDLLDIGALESRPGEPEVLWPDVRRLAEVVDWRPLKTLNEGLEQTVDWWRAEGGA